MPSLGIIYRVRPTGAPRTDPRSLLIGNFVPCHLILFPNGPSVAPWGAAFGHGGYTAGRERDFSNCSICCVFWLFRPRPPLPPSSPPLPQRQKKAWCDNASNVVAFYCGKGVRIGQMETCVNGNMRQRWETFVSTSKAAVSKLPQPQPHFEWQTQLQP